MCGVCVCACACVHRDGLDGRPPPSLPTCSGGELFVVHKDTKRRPWTEADPTDDAPRKKTTPRKGVKRGGRTPAAVSPPNNGRWAIAGFFARGRGRERRVVFAASDDAQGNELSRSAYPTHRRKQTLSLSVWNTQTSRPSEHTEAGNRTPPPPLTRCVGEYPWDPEGFVATRRDERWSGCTTHPAGTLS